MKYIYDSEIRELRDYVDKYSARRSQDTKAFMEILRLTEDKEIGVFEALIKIAGICEERLRG